MGARASQPSGSRRGGLIAATLRAAYPGTRACLHAALCGAGSDGVGIALPHSPLSRATLLDDLCRLFEAGSRLGIDDSSLACAAAEAPPAFAALAAVLYSARGFARAAGVDEIRQRGEGGANEADAAGVSIDTIAFAPTLREALEQLRARAAHVIAAPRRLVAALPESADATPSAALLRLLAAAVGNETALMTALRAHPYGIDPLELRQAAQAGADGQRGVNPKSLAAAMRGGPGRDAAFAAASAIETVRTLRQAKRFTLARAIDVLAEAVSGWAPSAEGAAQADIAKLRAAAKIADDVWAAAKQPAAVRVRSQVFVDAFACAALGPQAILVPRGSLRGDDIDAELCFADADENPMPWRLFAALAGQTRAAGADGDPSDGAHPMIVVAEPFPQAVTALLAEPPTAGISLTNWQWPAPETALPVVASGMTFSASRLNSYVKCSRRWFYEYLCAAIDEPASMQAAYGRVLHAALEALHREIRTPHQHSTAELLQRLLAELDGAFGRSRGDFSSQLEYEVCRQRARRVSEQYVRWLEQESKHGQLEIVHVELSQRFSRGGHQFVGYIDRIDQPAGGGPVTIYDYKTGRIDDDPQTYLDKVRRGEEAQLALYYAMRADSGERVGRIALVSLRDPRDDVWILALDIVPGDAPPVMSRAAGSGVQSVTCSQADLDASFAALIARCDLLTKTGVAHFAVGEDPPCGYCAYALACRERPADEERIFAR